MLDAIIAVTVIMMILYFLGPVRETMTNRNSEIKSQINDFIKNNLTPVDFYGKYKTGIRPIHLNDLVQAARRGELTDEKIQKIISS